MRNDCSADMYTVRCSQHITLTYLDLHHARCRLYNNHLLPFDCDNIHHSTKFLHRHHIPRPPVSDRTRPDWTNLTPHFVCSSDHRNTHSSMNTYRWYIFIPIQRPSCHLKQPATTLLESTRTHSGHLRLSPTQLDLVELQLEAQQLRQNGRERRQNDDLGDVVQVGIRWQSRDLERTLQLLQTTRNTSVHIFLLSYLH